MSLWSRICSDKAKKSDTMIKTIDHPQLPPQDQTFLSNNDGPLLDAYSNTVVNISKLVSPAVVQIVVAKKSKPAPRGRRQRSNRPLRYRFRLCHFQRWTDRHEPSRSERSQQDRDQPPGTGLNTRQKSSAPMPLPTSPCCK